MKKIIINTILGFLAGISILSFSYTKSPFYLIGLVGNIVIFTLYNQVELNKIKGRIKKSLK